MSYVQRVLQPGEQVRRISSIHWIGYWPGVAVGLLIQQWFQWWITEIAVTNRRIIYKKGLIRRQTNEMNMDKVESVQIDQSILGRMLNYGDITVRGTGTGLEPLKDIDDPIGFRNHVTAG